MKIKFTDTENLPSYYSPITLDESLEKTKQGPDGKMYQLAGVWQKHYKPHHRLWLAIQAFAKAFFSIVGLSEGPLKDWKAFWTGRQAVAVYKIKDLSNLTQKSQEISHTSQLLMAGAARKGTGMGEAPSFTGIQYFKKDTVIETSQLLAAAFACCFHSTESQEEILKLIREIRVENDPIAKSLRIERGYGESFAYLYNNLVKLHHALPGESKAKEVKIYWNTHAEKTLIPYLFQEEIELDNLVFAFLSGEECRSPFQAEKMNFQEQVQFVGLGKDKIFSDMKEKIEVLSQELLGKNIFEELHEIEGLEKDVKYPLLLRAYHYTWQNHVIHNLLAMHRQNKKINMNEMDKESQTAFLKELRLAGEKKVNHL
jgi:hypothetical protein